MFHHNLWEALFYRMWFSKTHQHHSLCVTVQHVLPAVTRDIICRTIHVPVIWCTVTIFTNYSTDQDHHSSQTNLSLKNIHVPTPSNPSMSAIWQPLFWLTQNIIWFLWQPNTLSFNLIYHSVPIWFCYLVLYAWCTAFFSHTSCHRV